MQLSLVERTQQALVDKDFGMSAVPWPSCQNRAA